MKLIRVRLTARRLMVAVGLSAVLLAATLLAQRVFDAGHRAACRQNLGQIGMSLIGYSVYHGSFPAGTVQNDRLPPGRRLSWLVSLWPYVEGWSWLLDRSEPWDSDANRLTRGHGHGEEPQAVGRIALLTCPAADRAAAEHVPGWTWYVGIAGVGRDAPALPDGHPRAGVFGYDRRTKPTDIKDGASTTIMLAETALANGPWTAGGPATVRGLDPSHQPYIGRRRQFGGTHRGGVMAAMADGSVRFVGKSIDPKVFEALATVAGGEALPEDWRSDPE